MQTICVFDLYNLLLSNYATASKGCLRSLLMPVLVSRATWACISTGYSAADVAEG